MLTPHPEFWNPYDTIEFSSAHGPVYVKRCFFFFWSSLWCFFVRMKKSSTMGCFALLVDWTRLVRPESLIHQSSIYVEFHRLRYIAAHQVTKRQPKMQFFAPNLVRFNFQMSNHEYTIPSLAASSFIREIFLIRARPKKKISNSKNMIELNRNWRVKNS